MAKNFLIGRKENIEDMKKAVLISEQDKAICGMLQIFPSIFTNLQKPPYKIIKNNPYL